jgi:Zn-dependent M28 family amino/carboxypeptidase
MRGLSTNPFPSAVHRLFVGLAAVGTVVVPPAASGQTQSSHIAGAITSPEIDADLRFLSSDLLEGRAPATRGGTLASSYIEGELEKAGVVPGNNGSYRQAVPIDVVDADQSAIRVQASGRATAALPDPEDVVVWSGSAVPSTAVEGELVFVGYGVQAPEYKWDDIKGTDLKGKILLILVNDPPATAAEPLLFGGSAMTYYGRWTYKFEEAERLGAVGALIVHTEERAGYPWHTVVGSWAKAQRMLPRDPALPAPLGFRGWITDSAATALLANAGLTLSVLRDRAASRDFRPVPTGITVSTSITNHVSHMSADNVVGVVAGRDPAVRNQYVVFSAHWDHLGIGPAVNGDSIYNGAADNASGVADVLAMARAAAALPAAARPRRSLLFLFVTAEESGLLGSAYFAEHPTVGAGAVIADLNIDGGNLLGRVRDLTVLGEHKSTLGPALARYAAGQGLRLAPEAHPEQGHFYRSDHFSFARAGVPAVSIGAGTDYVGRPREWGVQQDEDYTAHHYHQPSDEYRPDFDLKGAVQLSEIVLGFGMAVADAPAVPDWAPGAEFHRATSTAAVQ